MFKGAGQQWLHPGRTGPPTPTEQEARPHNLWLCPESILPSGSWGDRRPSTESRRSLYRLWGQGRWSVTCSYLLQVVVLAAPPREDEQAQTHSVSCLLLGVPSVGPLNAALVVRQEWRSWPSFPFLFAENMRERLVRAAGILRSLRIKACLPPARG